MSILQQELYKNSRLMFSKSEMASDTFEEEEPQEVGMVHFESGDDEKKGISSSRVV